jgi:hypothetical protein
VSITSIVGIPGIITGIAFVVIQAIGFTAAGVAAGMEPVENILLNLSF